MEPTEIEPDFNDHGNEAPDDSNQVQTTPTTSDVDDDDQQHSATRSNQRISATPGYLLTRDREKRIRKPNPKYIHADIAAYALLSYEELSENEPKTYYEAIKSKQSKEWQKAMEDEMKSLHENKTWLLVSKPSEQKIVDCKWIYKVKEGLTSSEPVRYKAKLVAKGFTQVEGVDYTKIFSPVVKYTTIRVILALVAQFNWELEQMDVKTAFLHGELEKTIYMKQPNGFEVQRKAVNKCVC